MILRSPSAAARLDADRRRLALTGALLDIASDARTRRGDAMVRACAALTEAARCEALADMCERLVLDVVWGGGVDGGR